ncbi:MAG: NACHT domain-containing protein [Xenococcus sp. MO_188.B8]|nr:NACHT domain-containing protein [Xenococcus sp. MO_188.B8]
MTSTIDDLVLDFYYELFTSIFSEPFREDISDRRKRNKVIRQVEEAADAASASLTRFFQYQKLTESQASAILKSFQQLGNLLSLEDVANSNVTTEKIVEDLLTKLPCPSTLQTTHEAVYRLALYTIVQVLMQVAQVMAEWQKLNFAETFELIRRVVNLLNEISRQVEAQGNFGQSSADRDYEILHRDYILQRFHKVEAGTVRMTTNLNVDLRELFVMPKVQVSKSRLTAEGEIDIDSVALMNLAAARKRYSKAHDSGENINSSETVESTENYQTALEQVTNPKYSFNVLVGLPGIGKSTFLEWLQVKLASVEETYILNGEQVIPLLLKVRQLDPLNLPQGSALIEKATASKDRATLMPDGWIHRQMKAGRILFMLDGLDEIEPELRDQYLIPWLLKLQKTYPKCDYLIASRPVGYPSGMLQKYKFVESELVDFNPEQIKTYTRNWCTAVRLARNELEAEARREGEIDGNKIAEDIQQSPYIRDLAHNPLMLSAICLVYYFESGKLPDDRVILYKLCVEGLLHHWDSRRGINSEFSFSEKLRACREVALAMQADDSAEYEVDKVQAIFTDVLRDAERANKLLEHIRYRTGLLLERRPNIFGFAHLTFQEYLAARAIHEGNRLNITAKQLATEHNDSRWKEVIALYSGVATTPAVRELIEDLIAQEDTRPLGEILTEVYFAADADLKQDLDLRKKVIKRIAISPRNIGDTKTLERFPEEEAVVVANNFIGKIKTNIFTSNAYFYLLNNPEVIDFDALENKIKSWKQLTPIQISELINIIHGDAPDSLLQKISQDQALYRSPGVKFKTRNQEYTSQADIALLGLSERDLTKSKNTYGFESSLLVVLEAISINLSTESIITVLAFYRLANNIMKIHWYPQSKNANQKICDLIKKILPKLKKIDNIPSSVKASTIQDVQKLITYLSAN